MDPANRQSKSLLAVNLGLAANILLAALKTAIGILGHSPALLADGINSTSDVAYYVVVRVFMQLARKPADNEHPYGHSQLESIAALVVGSFVITTAVAIFWNSANSFFELVSGQVESSGAEIMAAWVAFFTIALKLVLSRVTRQLGKSTHNAAVMALAYDHRNDVFSASAAAVGIILGRSGYPWVDPLAGALVALVILRTGIEILRESSSDLMDSVPGRELSEQVNDCLKDVRGVQQVEEVVAHRFGPYFVMNVTIAIDGSLSVAEGDQIASQVEQLLIEQVDLLRRVHVHYHPAKLPPGGDGNTTAPSSVTHGLA